MSEASVIENSPPPSTTISKDPLLRKLLKQSVHIEQLDHLIQTADLQEMMAENNRANREYHLQTEKATAALLAERQSFREKACGATEMGAATDTEDETGFHADFSESVHHHYPAAPAPVQPAAVAPSGAVAPKSSALKNAVLGGALTLAGLGLPALGTALGLWLASNKDTVSEPVTPSKTETVPTPGSGSANVEVQLFYRDPEKGLVPIPNAASLEGGELKEN